MTAIIPLGTFDRVSLRDAWPRENENFTPWLAKPENIKLLGDALNMELEVEAVEHRVGSFLADILAQAVDEADHHKTAPVWKFFVALAGRAVNLRRAVSYKRASPLPA